MRKLTFSKQTGVNPVEQEIYEQLIFNYNQARGNKSYNIGDYVCQALEKYVNEDTSPDIEFIPALKKFINEMEL